jgi:hypothetical protein
MFTIFATLRNTQKTLAARILILGMIIAMAFAMTIGFVWMQTDQVIAPPGLRIMNWLWGVFICICLV